MTWPHPYTAISVAVNLLTHGDYQFAVWWDLAGELRIGRIQRGVHRWGVNHTEFTFTGTPRTALDCPVHDDDHNFPCVFVDGLSRIHVMANMHNDPLRYVRTSAAHTTNGWTAAGGWVDASSEIPSVDARTTYPTPVPQPDGSIFFYARNSDSNSLSGRADSHCWTLSTGGVWSARTKIFQGLSVPDGGGPGVVGDTSATDTIKNWSAYPTNFLVESSRSAHPGRMHVCWVWRHTGAGGGVSGEENILPSYAYSEDKGVTWRTIDGTALTVPITPRNSVASRAGLNGALVNSLSRSSNIVICELDTVDHGLLVGNTITVVVEDATYNGDFTISAVNAGGFGQQWIAWAQTAANDPAGGVGSVTRFEYQNWGGIDVDRNGMPHILGSISPTKYIRRNAANTAWLESTVVNPLGGMQFTSRPQAFWMRNQLWMLVEAVPAPMRRVRLIQIDSPNRFVTLSGVVGDGQWEPSVDPEAWRRWGRVEVLAPDGNKPRVFSFPKGLMRSAA